MKELLWSPGETPSAYNLAWIMHTRIRRIFAHAGRLLFSAFLLGVVGNAAAGTFRFAEATPTSLGLWEGDRPVLVYNFGVQSKQGVPADRQRSTYVHPIYGLDGEVLTDDFPKDHYHHRGLFWAWPHIKIEDKEYSLWDLKGIRQQFERWLVRKADADAAVLGIENGWYVGDKKVVQEKVWLRVLPANEQGQMIDCELTWIPLEKAVTLSGAEGKSYGGLTLRFAPRTNTVITTPLGTSPQDLPMTRLPWADLSAQFKGPKQPSGAAIFIAPEHPSYPPEWLTRHYGVLCVGWPGIKPATFQPNETIRCRYRVWVHRGVPDTVALKRAYETFSASKSVNWPVPETKEK